jgi:hypothetical protein
VVGVRHDLVRAAGKPLHAVFQTQAVKANQRRLLGELIDSCVTDSENRDPIDAVNAVVAHRIRAQDVRVEVSAAYQDDAAVLMPPA